MPDGSGVTVGSAKTAETFVEITRTQLSPFPEVLGWPGIAVFDYDNDGDLDIFVTNGPIRSNLLYQNDGAANFVDVAAQAGVAATSDNGVTTGVGDFNNDGWLDLVVGRQIVATDLTSTSVVFFLNEGPGSDGVVTFRDATSEVGLSFPFRALAIGVGDLSGNGLLDLYLGNYDFDQMNFGTRSILPSMPNVLMTNLRLQGGLPQFNNDTAVAGVQGLARGGLQADTAGQQFVPATIAVHITDVNVDGLQDLFVLHDIPGGIDLYVNGGNGRFNLMDIERFNVFGGWMGVAPGDYDLDGDLDYFMTNIGSTGRGSPPEDRIITSSPFLPGGTPLHRLWNNNGFGGFTDAAPAISIVPSGLLPPTNNNNGTGLAAYEFGFGCGWIDADNRGLLDLVWTGDIIFDDGGPGRIFRYDNHGVGRFLKNDGVGGFIDQTAERGLFNMDDDSPLAFGENQAGRALAVVDLNNDGYEDLVVSNLPNNPLGRVGDIRVYLNPATTAGNWTNIELRGTVSNRFGIGARVVITAGGVTTVKEVITTTSGFTSIQPAVHFGLGQADVIDEVMVFWPSGRVSSHTDQPVNQPLTFEEPQ
jgi:hypothetical protein